MVRDWKRWLMLVLSVFMLTACSWCVEQQVAKQLELGQRYLLEERYEEAIVAFSKAIELDPKSVEAYLGRAESYSKLSEAEENLTLALADYERVRELDADNKEAFLGIADIYLLRGDYEAVLEILKDGTEMVPEDEQMSERLSEIETSTEAEILTEREIHQSTALISAVDEEKMQSVIELLVLTEASDEEVVDGVFVGLIVQQNNRYVEGFPKVEEGEGIAPMDSPGSVKGTAVPYKRCKTEELLSFVEDIYGRSFHIREGELMYPETRNEDGYFWEWGHAWIMSVEGGTPTYGESEFSYENNQLIVKTPYICEWADEILDEGDLVTIWEPNSESFLGYSLKEYRKEKARKVEAVSEAQKQPEAAKTLEEEIKEIRKIYYDIQEGRVALTMESDDQAEVVRYRNQDGSIVKVTATEKSYSNVMYPFENYSVEYYYGADSSHNLRFVFLYGSGEEHRIYRDSQGMIIRYIDENGTVYNGDQAVQRLLGRPDIEQFCSLGMSELTRIWKEQETIEKTNLSLKETGEEDRWKQEYISYIEGMEKTPIITSYGNKEVYKLIHIDGDRVPELYIDHDYISGGSVLCSYSNGKLIKQEMWTWGLSYLEGQNLFLDSGGRASGAYDRIYSIKDGAFTLLHQGGYVVYEGDKIKYDYDGDSVYGDFHWDGADVATKEEYINLLNTAFDTQKSICITDGTEFNRETMRHEGNGLCDYKEILKAIEQYP